MINYFKASKFLLYLVPFTIVIVLNTTLFPFIVGKYVLFRALVSLAFILFLLGLMLDQKADFYLQRFLRIMRFPLVIAVTIFVIAFMFSVFFGVDPAYSFWSTFERGEGGFQILALYVFFILLITLFKDKKDWRVLFGLVMLAAFFMIFYGVGAGLKYIDADFQTVVRNGQEVQELAGTGGPLYQTFQRFIGGSFSDPGFRFHGSIGNPAYVAAYLLFVIFFSAHLLFSGGGSFKSKRKLLITGSILFFGAFFFFAATRGAFIGLGVAVAAGLFYLIYTKKTLRKKLLLVVLVLTLITGTGFYFRDNPVVKSIPASRIFDISFSTETFRDRTIVWSMAWNGFKDRPIFGWGPENFPEIFYRHYEPRFYRPGGAWFDRAHSVFFDYLSETGAVGLLSYLSIFVVLFWQVLVRTRKYIKEQSASSEDQRLSREKEWSPSLGALFVAAPAAYLVQGLVLFDVLAIYVPLFIFLAFAAHKLGNASN